MTNEKSVSIQKATPRQIIRLAEKAFIAAGGDPQEFNREAAFAIQMFRTNDYLTKMDKQSIYDAIVNVALTGLTLNPELKLGYLIPNKGRLYFRSSYMGKKEILVRSGMIRDIWAELVYSNDEFIVKQGTERGLVHNLPEHPFTDRGEVVGGYWVAVLQNGEKPFGIMALEEIKNIMNRSESVKSGKGSPWTTDFSEMAKKTLINRAYKNLPKTGISKDVLRVLEADGKLDLEELDDYVKQTKVNEYDPLEDDSPIQEYDEAVVVPNTEQASAFEDDAPAGNGKLL